MASLNKVLIMGHLGKNPELRQTGGGRSVANMNIATSRKWSDDTGNVKEETEWHRVIVWGKQAESCAKYLEKGRGCLVEGRIQTRKYQGKDGIERYATEIVAENVVFLPSGQKKESEGDAIEAQISNLEDVPW